MKYGCYNISGRFKMPFHSHEGIEIDYLAKGSAYYLVGDKKIVLQKGDVFCLDPKKEHKLVIENNESTVYCVECVTYTDRPDMMCRVVRSDNLIREIFLDLLSQDYKSGISDSAFRYLCELLSRREDDRMDEVRDYLLLNYMNDLTVSDIAKEKYISPAHLQREFKKKFGIPIGEYLTKIRMFEAKNLILRTDMPIGEIDTHIGMKSRNSFTKAFVKEFGIPPREMRKRKSTCR